MTVRSQMVRTLARLPLGKGRQLRLEYSWPLPPRRLEAVK